MRTPRFRASGSSPLARGLPVTGGDDSIESRIIPARAGFTHSHVCSTRLHWDHPRSRGVYAKAEKAENRFVGSSPLARGLRLSERRGLIPGRIIPARAGFTRARPPRSWMSWDHPRSRGVYDDREMQIEAIGGSSPLARGLRGWLARCDRRLWIIPARAGFT